MMKSDRRVLVCDRLLDERLLLSRLKYAHELQPRILVPGLTRQPSFGHSQFFPNLIAGPNSSCLAILDSFLYHLTLKHQTS
jgi:hypothetical protein